MSADTKPLLHFWPFGDPTDLDFRAMVESVKEYAIYLLDSEGRVQSWNVGAQLMSGYTAGEILGRRADVFFTAEARAEGLPDRLLHKAAVEGQVEDEGWRVRKDGGRFWADVVLTAVREGNGRVAGYASVTRALSGKHSWDQEQRQRREHLWRNEERFRLLVEGVEEYAIFMLDPNGIVTTWNPGAERIKGYRADEIIGKHFSVFRTDEDVQAGACETELATAVRDGKLSLEGWRVRKDGSRFWASVALSALRDTTGKLMGFAKITRDLTQRRQLEEERVQRARAEEAVRLRDEFLLIASHELKTPLTSLQIDLHGMRHDPVDCDKQQRRLERAVRNVERLNGLIESLLNVSRLAQGQLVLTPARMDLRECVAHVIEAMRGQATRAGCEVRLLAPGAVSGNWDRLRVEQVVMNLLANAIKYGAGGPIVVAVEDDGREAVLEIRDSGPGVAAADMERIFERFERASSIRHFGGLGLGLYIVREIVNAHGGSITVRNPAQGGAALTVRLPLAEADEAHHAAAG